MELESGLDFFSRVGNRPSLTKLDDKIFPDGLPSPCLMEVTGSTSVGKSFLCLHILANTVLPRYFLGVPLGGHAAGAVIIDSDGKFHILQFANMLERRVKKACYVMRERLKREEIHQNSELLNNSNTALYADASEGESCGRVKKKMKSTDQLEGKNYLPLDVQCHESTTELGKESSNSVNLEKKDAKILLSISKKDFTRKVNQLVEEALKRIVCQRCNDSTQFAVSLLTLDQVVQADSNISLMIIDSISAFYWYDRVYRCDSWSKAENYYTEILKNIAGTVKKNKLTCLVTRQSLFGKPSKEEDLKSGPVAPEQNFLKHVEDGEYDFLGKVWSSLVDITLNLGLFQKDFNEPCVSYENPAERTRAGYIKKAENKCAERPLEVIRPVYSIRIKDRCGIRSLVMTYHEDGIHFVPATSGSVFTSESSISNRK